MINMQIYWPVFFATICGFIAGALANSPKVTALFRRVLPPRSR